MNLCMALNFAVLFVLLLNMRAMFAFGIGRKRFNSNQKLYFTLGQNHWCAFQYVMCIFLRKPFSYLCILCSDHDFVLNQHRV